MNLMEINFLFFKIFLIINLTNLKMSCKELAFGKHLLNLFYLDPSYINVNHGSYGCPPRVVMEKYRSYQEQMEFNPEKWIRFSLNEKINESREIVSKYINADINNLVIVENASDGINSVFKSMLTSPGDKILMMDIAYSTAKNTAKFLSDLKGIKIVEVIIDEEALNSDESDEKGIISKLENAIKLNLPIKLANIDHISSVPAILLPIKKIIELFHKYNIPVFVDGAHAVGQIQLDMTDLKPDFYISNFHKWGFNNKSACFLYVAPQFQTTIHPNIISSGYGKGFITEFSYLGCKDYSAFLTIKDALEFRANFGENEIMEYNRNLAFTSGNEIANMWGTELLVRDKSKSCAMVNVRIPFGDEKMILNAVQEALFEFNTYIPTFKFSNGNFYARFSAQIYNDISDYLYASKVFLNLLTKNKTLDSNNFKPKF